MGLELKLCICIHSSIKKLHHLMVQFFYFIGLNPSQYSD